MQKIICLLLFYVPLVLYSQNNPIDSLFPPNAKEFYKIKRPELLSPNSSTTSDSFQIPDFILERGKEKIGKEFPAFNNYSIKDEHFSSESIKGKVVFINFWFENCPPCVAEFKALNDLYQKYKENEHFQFLTFTFEKKEKALKAADKYNLKYPVISLSPDSCRKLLNNKMSGYPTNIIIDKGGKIQLFLAGGPKDPTEAKKIEQFLYIPKIEEFLNDLK